MTNVIEVVVKGAGRVRGADVERDATSIAHCSICARDADAVATVGTVTACADCLRERLDALSIGRFRLREPQSGGLPWGKISG